MKRGERRNTETSPPNVADTNRATKSNKNVKSSCKYAYICIRVYAKNMTGCKYAYACVCVCVSMRDNTYVCVFVRVFVPVRRLDHFAEHLTNDVYGQTASTRNTGREREAIQRDREQESNRYNSIKYT